MAAFSTFRLSCGEALLSKPTTSNVTPAGFFLPLTRSAMNWKLFSWFAPRLANGPDRGSIQAILTVSPAWAWARPACNDSTAAAVRVKNGKPNGFFMASMASSRGDCDSHER